MTKQLWGVGNIASVDLEPIDFSMASVRELSAKWLAEMSEYTANNPQFIANGFRRSGISSTLDHCQIEDDSELKVVEELLSDENVSENDVVGMVSSDTDSSDNGH